MVNVEDAARDPFGDHLGSPAWWQLMPAGWVVIFENRSMSSREMREVMMRRKRPPGDVWLDKGYLTQVFILN